MIESIQIQNRQSHEDTTVHLHPGLNVIVGRGTSGKSAILRALRWPLENTAGTAQISRWIMREPKGKSKDLILDGETAVTVTKPQGVLRRFRNQESNGYEVHGKTLKAVGVSVPEEAKEFFNLSDVNIQGQFDPPFLISLPGSQVSAYLNRVVGIEEIDKYLTASASCIREAKKIHKSLVEAQTRDTEALEALAWVEGIQEQATALDAMQATRGALETKLTKVGTVRCDLESEVSKRAKYSQVADLDAKVQAAKKLYQTVTGVGSRLSLVARHVKALEAARGAKAQAAKVAGLAADLEEVVCLDAELLGAHWRKRMTGEWVAAYTEMQAKAAKASKVTRLQGAWEAAVGANTMLAAKTLCRISVVGFATKWETVKESLTVASKVAALEFQMVKAYRFHRGLQATSVELESLRDLGLTIKGYKAKLVSKRAEVSELESKRPKSCPLCGGAYGKGECDGVA
jgi:hypothetical protein